MSPRKRRLTALLSSLFIILALVGWLYRPTSPRYTVTDLGTLPGDRFSSASGINSRGDVVGLSGPTRVTLHVFLYRSGAMTDLGQSGQSNGGPAISDSGSVTGVLRLSPQANGPGQGIHAFLYGAGGMRDLGTPLGAPTSRGTAINGSGQVAGEAWMDRQTVGGYVDHGFLRSGGRTMDIGILPGCLDVTPTGLNAAGQVVGYSRQPSGTDMQAFLYDGRTRKMTALATPPGSTGGMAAGINDHGQVIGAAMLSFVQARAVLWAGGRVTVLGTLPGTGGAGGTAINNRGEAVGMARPDSMAFLQFVHDHPIQSGPLLPLFPWYRAERAWVYRAGRMTALEALLPARSGWALERATGINDRGQIVGEGLHDGKRRAFLLTPR